MDDKLVGLKEAGANNHRHVGQPLDLNKIPYNTNISRLMKKNSWEYIKANKFDSLVTFNNRNPVR
jgi:hypothetical protein